MHTYLHRYMASMDGWMDNSTTNPASPPLPAVSKHINNIHIIRSVVWGGWGMSPAQSMYATYIHNDAALALVVRLSAELYRGTCMLSKYYYCQYYTLLVLVYTYLQINLTSNITYRTRQP